VTIWTTRIQMCFDTKSPASVISFRIVSTYHCRLGEKRSAKMATRSTSSSRMAGSAVDCRQQPPRRQFTRFTSTHVQLVTSSTSSPSLRMAGSAVDCRQQPLRHSVYSRYWYKSATSGTHLEVVEELADNEL
jgi:hypothetical protein